MAALREVRAGYRVTGRSVIQRRNFRDLPNIVDAARQIGLDQVSFLAADVSTDAFNRADPWDGERVADVALSRGEALEFERLLEETLAARAADFDSRAASWPKTPKKCGGWRAITSPSPAAAAFRPSPATRLGCRR